MNPLQSVVTCADCGRQYQCSPLDDHYLRAGDSEGSPRVCFTCLVSTANQVGSMRPRSDGVENLLKPGVDVGRSGRESRWQPLSESRPAARGI